MTFWSPCVYFFFLFFSWPLKSGVKVGVCLYYGVHLQGTTPVYSVSLVMIPHLHLLASLSVCIPHCPRPISAWPCCP